MTCHAFFYPEFWATRRLHVHKSYPINARHATTAKGETPSKVIRRRAPRTFVRLLHQNDDTILLQTSVTTYISPLGKVGQRLDLHALLHIADASYYKMLQSSLSKTSQNGAVLFELLTSERNVSTEPYPHVMQRQRAVGRIRTTAAALGGVAQMDAIDPTVSRWRIADISAEAARERASKPKINFQEVGVVGLQWLIALWLPCPELYVALVEVATGRIQVPPRAVAAVLRGDIVGARRVAFASRISIQRPTTRAQTIVDRRRNAVAWDAVCNALSHTTDDNKCPPRELALLYGAWHAPALCTCAEMDGWEFSHVTWRTAMRVYAPSLSRSAFTILIAIITAYVAYAATDWAFLVDCVGQAFAEPPLQQSLYTNILFYFFRHIPVYVLFRKWFVVWDNQ